MELHGSFSPTVTLSLPPPKKSSFNIGRIQLQCMYRGLCKKKKGRNTWKKDKLATFSLWKKDKKRGIRTKLDVKSQNFTNF